MKTTSNIVDHSTKIVLIDFHLKKWATARIVCAVNAAQLLPSCCSSVCSRHLSALSSLDLDGAVVGESIQFEHD